MKLPLIAGICSLLILIAIAQAQESGIRLERDLLSPGELLRVEVRHACNVTLFGPNLTKPLFHGSEDLLRLEVNTSDLPLGYYRILNECNGSVWEANFTLDELLIEVISPQKDLIAIETRSKLRGVEVDAAITVDGVPYDEPLKLASGKHLIEANYSGLRSSRVLEVPEIISKEFYTPLEEVSVLVRSQEKPNITLVSPLGEEEVLEARELNSTHWLASMMLKQPVYLGSYEFIVSLGNLSFSRSFQVTYFELNYSYDGRILELSLRDALTGEPARGLMHLSSCFWNSSYEFNGSISVETGGGPVKIALEDERGLLYETTLEGVSTERELYFPGDEVKICAAGRLTLSSPSGRVLMDLSVEGVEVLEYPLTQAVELGNYSLKLKNVTWSFSVDSYEMNARFIGDSVFGEVSYFVIAPKEVKYVAQPSNSSGVARVVNGSFRIELPEGQESVSLECGNAKLTLERECLPYKEIAGLKLETNVSCLEAEEREGGLLIRLRSLEGFTAILRVYPVAEELIPLSEDGKILQLRTRASGGVQEFLIKDGSSSDPDGTADGEIVMLLVKGSNRGAEVNESAGLDKAALTQTRKPELREVRELLAEGQKGKWRIKIYELLGGHSRIPSDLIPLKRKDTFVREEKLGEAEVGVSYRKLKEGKILVEVSGKEGKWVRVEVELPVGAVADEVLAINENGTKKLDLWYQKGNKLVFYDDPNRYYYVLYSVPPWWDPDGICKGYDWHYRVPIQVPPMVSDHTLYFDVNFTMLLGLMNVSGTFDENSVRVVDDQGSLVPRQEFLPLGNGLGRVKFILHKDLSSPVNFYVYFDIVENGAKPYFNTLNAGLDSGTLNYWIYGRNPSTIGSIIEASPKGPFTVYDPYGSPNYVQDDATPVFGSHSLVLGYRTSSGSEDETTTGEDTWAYYEFRVPSDGGMLYFWYRVESWDSLNYDYFRAELRDASGNTLATMVPNFNPNPGDQYGPYRDSGWLAASYDLSAYAGQSVRAYFLVHTYSDSLYKTWAYIDNLTWAPVDLTSQVISDMVEGFGVNVTMPKGMLNYGPLRIEAKVDAKPSSVIARIYNPSGSFVASATLYDDGTNGDAVANDGIYTNANAYFLAPGSPLGKWRVVVLANDSSSSTYSPAYNGLIHIPSRPYDINYTDFFNVGESSFYLGPLSGEVFEDKYPIGAHGIGDAPFSNVYVFAFRDDDGTFDPLNDPLVTWSISRTDGAYRLSVLPGSYFLTLNSRTLMPPEGLNSGHSADETWAEQTYQAEWNGSAYVGVQKLGGVDPSVSDACTLELVLHDDFETWSGWQAYGQGGVRQSNVEFYNGTYSLEKYTRNDPQGGYKLLGRTIGRSYVLQGYAFRPVPIGVRSRVSVSLVDSSYNGYGFVVDHRNNRISIVRRANGAIAATLASQAYDPPEETWYFWKFILLRNNTIIFRLYDTNYKLLAQVRATDASYSTFDRVLVQGDSTYYLDTLVLWRLPDRCEHILKVDTSNYSGESLDFGFSYEVIVNTKDSDDAPSELRFAQGSIRQFLINSNAIVGMQKSYFMIPKTDSGYVQEASPHGTVDVWRIKLSSELPQVTDSVNLTAKTQHGVSSYVKGSYVGCDNYRIPDFGTPRIEIDGNGYTVFNLSARYAQLEGFSIYMTPYAVVALGSDNRYLIRDNFIGAYANGTDAPKVFFGVYVGKYGSPIIYKNLSATIRHNLIAKNLHYGIVVNSGNLANATIEENWVRGCGAEYSVGDGISLQTNGNLVIHNLIEGNGNNGDISTIDGGAGIEVIVWNVAQSEGITRVLYNTVANNSRWGVSILSSYAKANVTGNVIRGNGVGVIVADTSVANVTKNCFYNNSRVGIDLDASDNPNGDDVTLNDGLLVGSQPNKGMDYPVITSATLIDDQLYVEGFVGSESAGGSPAFAGALVDIYLVRNSTKGDDLIGNNLSSGGQLPKSYGEGWIYLGRLTADSDGKFSGTINITGKGVDPGSLLTGTSTINGTSEFGPNAPVLRLVNLSVSVRVEGNAAEITVKAHERAQHYVTVYWRKPAGIEVASMSGDYDASGTYGDVYWWRFNLIPANQQKSVYLTFSSTGDYSLLEAHMIGLDPPENGLRIEVKEFSTIKLNPDGTYDVSRLWGFLTLNNSSPDPLSNLELYLDAPGYTFYLDYPNPSGTPLSPPLSYPYLAPKSYVRWRYEAPVSEALVPIEVRERNLSCGVEVTVVARDDLSDVVLRKLGQIWEIGDMRKGDIARRSFNVSYRGCRSEVASVEFSYANASLLKSLRELRGISDAEVSVEKQVSGGFTEAKVRAIFRNGASSFTYNLTRICLLRSPSGPVLMCESPNAILRPGESYETAHFTEIISGVPVYYANASFTIIPSVSGSTVPLRSIASGFYLASASLPETVCCGLPVQPPPPIAPPMPARAPGQAPTETGTISPPGLRPREATQVPTQTTVPKQELETRTETRTPTIPTYTVPENATIPLPPELRKLPFPFLMVLTPPLLVLLLIARRRSSFVVIDYATLNALHRMGRLQDLAGVARVAITDITLLRAMSDEDLLRAIVSINPEVHVMESSEIDMLLSSVPSGLDFDTLLARQLALRLNADFLPDLLLGR